MPMSLPTSSSEKSPAQDQDVPLSTNRTLDDGAVAEDNSIPEVAPALAQHDFMFWAVLAALSLTGMLAALEATIITSALPTITNALGGGSSYVWVANAYQIPFIAALPLIAQVSDIFGRRWPIIGSVGIFVLGSGLCGGATSMGMLIAGRAVQGLGGGGITLLIETVVTDLVPLRERGKYMGITLLGSIIGSAGGPFIGGLIVDKTTWRWIFYLNLPIGTVALVGLFVFLRTKYQTDQTWKQRLVQIDFLGNAIFVASIVAVLISLTWGGTLYAWSDYQVIVPLVLGFVGLGLWVTFEWTLCKKPSFPRVVMANRTSSTVLVLTLLHTVCTYWVFYFVPIYFQAVKGESALLSGVFTLPVFAGILPFAIAGGVVLSKWGRFKPLHLIGWALVTLSCGLFCLLDAGSGPAKWVIFQLIFAMGAGVLAVILLPAVQAPLDEKLVSLATGIWTFFRGFGGVWGVTIPSAIFNNECKLRAEGTISDPQIAGLLTGGRAYDHATKAFLDSIKDPASREQVVQVFQGAIRSVFYALLGFAALGFLLSFVEKEVPLRDELNTEFGLEKEKQENGATRSV